MLWRRDDARGREGAGGEVSPVAALSATIRSVGRPKTYKVKSGDTLYSISRTLNTSERRLIRANPSLRSDPDFLRVGVPLSVPPLKEGRRSRAASPVPPRPPETVQVAVRRGDTLSTIAAAHKIPLEGLRRLNGIGADSDHITVGQRLRVPKSSKSERRPQGPNPLAALGGAVGGAVAGLFSSLGRHNRAQRSMPAPRTYTVREGESLVAIAAKYRKSPRELQLYNRLRSENIRSGDVLKVDPPPLTRSDFFAAEAEHSSRAVAPLGLRSGRRTHRRVLLRAAAIDGLGAKARKAALARAWTAGVGGPDVAAGARLSLKQQLRIKLSGGVGRHWRALVRAHRRGTARYKQGAASRLRFKNPVATGFVSSPYGYRWGSFHEGVDLAAETGTPIAAADSGVVTFAGWGGGYGRLVEVEHAHGYTTRYGHCDALAVQPGQVVARGQKVATVGASGRAFGPHLHFEVRKNGYAKDPQELVRI